MPLLRSYKMTKRPRCVPTRANSSAATADELDSIDIAFFDTREPPSVDAMMRAAALCNSSARVRFWAILRSPRVMPGFRVVTLQLSPLAQCLYDGLRALSHHPGTEYLYKPLLHYVMPLHLRRVILLDTDVIMLRDVTELHRNFGLFGEAVVGLAAEQDEMYLTSTGGLVRGVNGGVQLLDLEAMRSNPEYDAALDEIASASDGVAIGRNGDQTLYTMIMYIRPSLVKVLPCEFNRQLFSPEIYFVQHLSANLSQLLHKNSSDGHNQTARAASLSPIDALRRAAPRHRSSAVGPPCDSGCSLLHPNNKDLKCIATIMQSNPSCRTWEAFLISLAEGRSKRVEDLLIGTCPHHWTPNMRWWLAHVLRSDYRTCCVNGYAGALRPPSGAAGAALVTRSVRAAHVTRTRTPRHHSRASRRDNRTQIAAH